MDKKEKDVDSEEEEEEKESEESDHCEYHKLPISRESSTNSSIAADEEAHASLSPSQSPEADLDQGEEADSESDDTETKKTKKTKKRKMVQRKRAWAVEKGEAAHNGKEQNGSKKSKSQPFRRKKIRKILTDDKLQEETLRALKEEEERIKRLGIQARSGMGASNTPENAPAQMPFEITNDVTDLNFDDLDFVTGLDNFSYGNASIPETSINELTSFLGSEPSVFGEGQTTFTSENIPSSSACLEIGSRPSDLISSNRNLTTNVSTMGGILTIDPARTTTPSSVHPQPMSNGHAPTSTINNVLIGDGFKVTMATLSGASPAPSSVQSVLPRSLAPSQVLSPALTIKTEIQAKPKKLWRNHLHQQQ